MKENIDVTCLDALQILVSIQVQIPLWKLGGQELKVFPESAVGLSRECKFKTLFLASYFGPRGY